MKIDYAKIDEVNGEITQRDRQETCGTGFSSRSRSLRTYTEKIWRSRKI